MHNWRWYDWIVVTVAWGFLSILAGVFLAETVAEEVGAVVGFGLGFGGPAVLYARRLLRLARGEGEPGLTTGQMQAERITELEQRITELESLSSRLFDLEERVDFSERILATRPEAPRLPEP